MLNTWHRRIWCRSSSLLRGNRAVNARSIVKIGYDYKSVILNISIMNIIFKN